MTEASRSIEPSELEGCVLGTVARLGTCTAYAVRKAFRESLTTSWRGSAGAIYPLLKRQAAAGLIKEDEVVTDGRGTKMLCLTEAGRAALARWVEERESWIGEPAADPIRTRFQFIDFAGQTDQKALIDSWIDATLLNIARVERASAEIGADEPLLASAHRATQLQLEARLKWLEELRENPPC